MGKGMLVLTRRVDEELVIDESTTVKVLRVNGNKVRLGIVGEVPVRRGELPVRPRAGDVGESKDEVIEAEGAGGRMLRVLPSVDGSHREPERG